MQKFTPLYPYEKWIGNFCPHCGAKLGLKERYKKKYSTKILCRCCGKEMLGDMVLIGNTKFPKRMIKKRF